jgi:anti-anti-sigma regulatory factor
MFQIEVDKPKNLLTFIFSGRVTPQETASWRENLGALLADVQPGFRLLTDLSGVDSMDTACATDIEWSMELLDKSGVTKVVRIITHPRQDIGLSIMSLFHYRHRIPIVTCKTMAEAMEALAT